jgi:sulfur carrier protein
MRIELNGRELDVRDGTSVAELVRQAGARPDARGVAVALDGEVVPRGDWDETEVAAGQAVEVLEAIQGG